MWWLLLFFAFEARAETILIPAPSADLRGYHARLQADSERTSPTAVYLRRHPLSGPRERLLNRYAEAQAAFLQESPEQARQKFESVIQLLAVEDWSKMEREIFLTSFLRLAQLDSSRQDEWLRQALTLGPGLKVDTTLFPPPLVARLEKLRDDTPRLNPSVYMRDWPRLLINGVSCTRSSCPEFPTEGMVRVTFLSDLWQPQTLNTVLSDIAKLTPARVPWVSGSCAHPSLSARAAELGANEVYWGESECAPAEKLNLHPLAAAPDPRTLTFPAPKPSRAPLLRSKWFWAGVVTVAAVLIVNGQKRVQEEQRQPTTTYGN